MAQALNMSEALLGYWVRAAQAQATHHAGSEENKQLQAQLAYAEMTAIHFRKALTIFSRLTDR